MNSLVSVIEYQVTTIVTPSRANSYSIQFFFHMHILFISFGNIICLSFAEKNKLTLNINPYQDQ